MTTENKNIYSAEEFDAIRGTLDDSSGPEYWRSLDELSQTESFKEYVHNEFPGQAGEMLSPISRRNFLQVMGSSLALAGVTTGCSRQPLETIHPYVQPPEEIIPGKPLYFASAAVLGGYAQGILVESHMGRPTKIEGLPGFPSTAGKTSAQVQATILDLYDPDRVRGGKKLGRAASYDAFVGEAKAALDDSGPKQGAGIRILTGAITSPSEHMKIQTFLKAYPNAKWHQYEPTGRDNEHEGAKLAFGEVVDTLYRFDKADVVVALDSDFLEKGPAHVRYAADYAARRDVESFDAAHEGGHHGEADESSEASHAEFHAKLNRTYAVESSPTLIGAMADHKFPVRPSQIEAVARALADSLGVSALPGGDSGLSEGELAWIETVANDLKHAKGHSIVVTGSHQTPAVHALTHEINKVLNNVGATVSYIEPVEENPVNHQDSLRALVDDMNAGRVNFLLVAGNVNPVYSAPVDFGFKEAFLKVGLRARLSRYSDETGVLSQWQLPELHTLEHWGDARGHDGTVALVQPQIAPLYGGHVLGEVLSSFIDETAQTNYEITQAHWKAQWGETGFDSAWKTALSNGVVSNSASRPKRVTARSGSAGAFTKVDAPADGELEVVFIDDPSIGDGLFSNNAWLQEVPNPLTKITWDNAILVGYSTAQELGVGNEDLVEVSYDGRTVQGPVWVQPGHAKNTVTLHLGYGRTAVGKVGVASDKYLGFNAYSLRTSNAGFGGKATIKKLAGTYPLARTEEHFNMEGRGLVRHVTEEKFTANPGIVLHGENHEYHNPAEYETMMKPDEKKWEGEHRNRWAMTIDLNKCTGCNACIVACQSENIIPVVGKDEVRKGREMQWIRIDRYFYADREKPVPFLDAKENPRVKSLKAMTPEMRNATLDNPTVYFQPVPCMQCENALCEVVCPVGATQHSREGLNDMVYNRCIGTRYCSNNCPYKVRRFNFFNYGRTPLGSRGDRAHNGQGVKAGFEPGHVHPESLKPMRNPDVTLRTRGVMEKCTYCVQRINHARIEAKKGDREIHDGEVVVACQQACPSSAIDFGNLNDTHSAIVHRKQSARNYGILADLNTKARTTYLAKITNPNPELNA